MRGRTVVELGSGTAVISVSAATRGAFVIATDLQSLVDLMKANKGENLDAIKAADGKLECLALDWTEDLPRDLTRTLSNWNRNDGGLDGVFGTESSVVAMTFPDMILVSDCVYYEAAVDPLVKTLTALTGPKTLVLLSIEDRESAQKVGHVDPDDCCERKRWSTICVVVVLRFISTSVGQDNPSSLFE